MMNKSFGQKVWEFYKGLELKDKLPKGIEVMNPYTDKTAGRYVQKFLDKYFSDNNKRILVLGINPGRFGSGITGVTFTDPVALFKYCGIENDLGNRRELSSEFVYDFIDRWGGAKKFYKDFFLSALSLLGFTKSGKNYNFYDDARLEKAVTPFIVRSLEKHLEMGGRKEAVILFGSGKNYKYLKDLNSKHQFFNKIHVLDHPRFIMQYRRKQKNEYIKQYEEIFSEAISSYR